MHADVGAVPIVFVREEDGARLLRGEDAGDHLYHARPVRGILGAAFRGDLLQPVRRRLDEAEADVAAGLLQFGEPFGLTGLGRALRDGDVDHVPRRLAPQPQRQGADDALVVRVRRKDQRLGRTGGHRRIFGRGIAPQAIGFAFPETTGVGGHERRVRIHAGGRLTRRRPEGDTRTQATARLCGRPVS
jgi:hypothetical protein